VAASSDLANCPVCCEPFGVYGPVGVLVHLLALHPHTEEARWVARQVSLLDQRELETIEVPTSEPVG
jgi:hypothetical protein